MRNIPFSPPDITELEIQEVCEALRSGWITTGPRTKQLEKELAEYCQDVYKRQDRLRAAVTGESGGDGQGLA